MLTPTGQQARPAWPTPNEYCAAVQNPRNCFPDRELAGGRIVLNPLGLPKVSSGNFAVVFELERGDRRYAVKCFTRQIQDQQQRYAAITRFLAGRILPFLVSFRYLAQGLRCGGGLFPLLTMEWVDGELLHQYVERQLGTPSLIRDLAEQWRSVVAHLKGYGVAHGDLQHRNILVAAGRLRLVDYDGMFVPGLRGMAPDERGNDHFQHPNRSKRDYDEHVDRFAALVIYLSLRALAADPSLWTEFHSGENLVLSRGDYVTPGATSVWRRLAGSPDVAVRQLGSALERACRDSLSGVPDLETALRQAQPPVAMAATDWRKLGQALGIGPASAQRPTAPIPIVDWAQRQHSTASGSDARTPPPAGTARCPEGHAVLNGSFLRYCPECLAKGKRTALYGWRRAPCGHTIPDGSHFCPDCRAPTGW
jgi:hypothetical protein